WPMATATTASSFWTRTQEGWHLRQRSIRLEANPAGGRGVRLRTLARSAAAIHLHDRRREPSRLDPESRDVAGDRPLRPAGIVWRLAQRAARDRGRQSRQPVRWRELRRAPLPALPVQGTGHSCTGCEPADDRRALTEVIVKGARLAGSPVKPKTPLSDA